MSGTLLEETAHYRVAFPKFVSKLRHLGSLCRKYEVQSSYNENEDRLALARLLCVGLVFSQLEHPAKGDCGGNIVLSHLLNVKEAKLRKNSPIYLMV